MPGIDIHAHLAPLLDGEEPAGPPGAPALHEPERLLAHLDGLALDEAVVSIPPPFYRTHLDAADWVPRANDGLRARVAGHVRLSTFAYLPLDRPEVALAELDRAGSDHAGFTAAAGGASPSLAEPALDPVWTALDEAAATLLVHPGATPDARMEAFYLGNLLGNPVETTLAAAQLVFGEILTRFPRVRVVLVHGGGAVAVLAARWQRGVETERPGVPALAEPPLDAIRRLYVDTVTHDPLVTALAVERFGGDRLVLGSDWPFPMGAFELPEHPDVERFATTNAAAALGRAPSQ